MEFGTRSVPSSIFAALLRQPILIGERRDDLILVRREVSAHEIARQ
jgi:hypothetical protein